MQNHMNKEDRYWTENISTKTSMAHKNMSHRISAEYAVIFVFK